MTRALPNPDSRTLDALHARHHDSEPGQVDAGPSAATTIEAEAIDADTIEAEPVFKRARAADPDPDLDPTVGEIRGASVHDRLSGLINASGWIVVLVDDFHRFREWERLNTQLEARTGDAAKLRAEMRPMLEQVYVEILPVLAWAVRSRPGDPDEIVPLVPWNSRVGAPDDIVVERHMLRMASLSFLDEDERRFLTRDGVVRRKLEWYAEKVAR